MGPLTVQWRDNFFGGVYAIQEQWDGSPTTYGQLRDLVSWDDGLKDVWPPTSMTFRDGDSTLDLLRISQADQRQTCRSAPPFSVTVHREGVPPPALRPPLILLLSSKSALGISIEGGTKTGRALRWLDSHSGGYVRLTGEGMLDAEPDGPIRVAVEDHPTPGGPQAAHQAAPQAANAAPPVKAKGKGDEAIWMPGGVVLSHERLLGKKDLVRGGVPQRFRVAVWKSLLEIGNEVECNAAYADAQRRTWGEVLPPDYDPPLHPLFGGKLSVSYFELSKEKEVAARRVLSVLGAEEQQMKICPQVPPALGLLLRWLSEAEAFCGLRRLVSAKGVGKSTGYFAEEAAGGSVRQRVALRILAKDAGAAAGGGEEEWFASLFTSVLRLDAAERVFEWFLNEGNKVLFRTGLALIRFKSSVTSPDIVAAALGISLSRKDVKKAAEKAAKLAGPDESAAHASEAVGYSRLTGRLATLCHDLRLWDLLSAWVPARCRGHRAEVMFRSSRDGNSFHTLYSRCAAGKGGPQLLLCKAAPELKTGGYGPEELFGFFTIEPLEERPGNYGTGDSFCFSLMPAAVVFTAVATSGGIVAPLRCARKTLSFGLAPGDAESGESTGAALSFWDDLSEGESAKSVTFRNQPFCSG
eukprot:Hpha_TRINITY_DN17656_c0_g1::TRINITY_DN17656_c0_g1_i1::g.158713::m.158713